eukprot:TRINITY_DN10767_c0_g1_i2.p1 TRINITY_DN10767_c0_g1~~TRINITY_DN10767_c0_g1_i2.p1  ORF type:complete len:152 (+),score=35.00 TRINITY_DN10767_c0_g1_i2:153-608(+)
MLTKLKNKKTTTMSWLSSWFFSCCKSVARNENELIVNNIDDKTEVPSGKPKELNAIKRNDSLIIKQKETEPIRIKFENTVDRGEYTEQSAISKKANEAKAEKLEKLNKPETEVKAAKKRGDETPDSGEKSRKAKRIAATLLNFASNFYLTL